jgi:hypothetical protein
VIDSAAMARQGYSETAAEIFERNGVSGFVEAAKERVVGWNNVHQFLRWDLSTEPQLQVFDTCYNLIRTLPLAQHDEKKPEDIAVSWMGAEHWDAIDDLRYFLRTLRDEKSPRPMSAVEKRLAQLKAMREAGMEI